MSGTKCDRGKPIFSADRGVYQIVMSHKIVTHLIENLTNGGHHHVKEYVQVWQYPPLGTSTIGIKLIAYYQGAASHAWLIGMVNGISDSTFCLTSFLVLHCTTCGYVCINQQVSKSNTMKEKHTNFN